MCVITFLPNVSCTVSLLSIGPILADHDCYYSIMIVREAPPQRDYLKICRNSGWLPIQ
jgi:hypothetical protein